jgi:N-acetylmuramoyl-L-alanine amidase
VIGGPDTPLATALYPSPNFGVRRGRGRPDMLLLHYTGLADVTEAIDWLCRPESRVSAHYVVDETGRIAQLVAESMRAWHAGVATWAGESDINSVSVGIEIHNPGHDLGYCDFPEAQLGALEALCLDIIARHRIRPERVLAHSDVAPARKQDPGEKFPWARLAAVGIGHWVAPVPIAEERGDVRGSGAAAGPAENRGAAAIAATQAQLAAYGYGIAPTGEEDAATHVVVRAFQRHFRPQRVDGCLDASTVATLRRLIAALPARAGA